MPFREKHELDQSGILKVGPGNHGGEITDLGGRFVALMYSVTETSRGPVA